MSPPLPENVVAHYRDGRTVPLELVYRGVDADGRHRWVATAPLGDMPERVTIDVLPAHTTVEVEGEVA